MNIGATVTCTRSSRPAARNADTVTPAALDEDARTPTLSQVGHDFCKVGAAGTFAHAEQLGPSVRGHGAVDVAGGVHVQRRRLAVLEDVELARQPGHRVDDDPQRIGGRSRAGS